MNDRAIPTQDGCLTAVYTSASGVGTRASPGHMSWFSWLQRGWRTGRYVGRAGVGSRWFYRVRFDFTPHQPLSRQITEIRDVVTYCRQYLGRDIVLLGRSMGGSAALAFAAQDQDIRGLCLWATPYDLQETFRVSLGNIYQRIESGEIIHIHDENGALTLSPEFIADFKLHNLSKCVEAIGGIPLLVVHGSHDTVVPLSQAENLYHAATDPKKLVVIQGRRPPVYQGIIRKPVMR